MPLLALFLLSGCSPGPNTETLIDELRVVAVVAEPPEIGPGETTDVMIHLADPKDSTPEAMVWSCVLIDRDRCLEDGTPLDQRVWRASEVGPELDLPMVASPALGALIDDGISLPLLVWTLACAPGSCDLFDDIDAAQAEGITTDALDADLADPTSWLGDVPRGGVSLASWPLRVTGAPLGSRHSNPELVVEAPAPSVRREEAVSIRVRVQAAGDAIPTLYGFATGGGFDDTAYSVDETGLTEIFWYAPTADGPVDLWIVAQDDLGGSALWTGSIIVREPEP